MESVFVIPMNSTHIEEKAAAVIVAVAVPEKSVGLIHFDRWDCPEMMGLWPALHSIFASLLPT